MPNGTLSPRGGFSGHRPEAAQRARSWAPDGTSRGTVVLLPGRGEHPQIYERFGLRLAADGYTVIVPEPDAADHGSPLDWFNDGLSRPFVLAGSDTGARFAVSAALDRVGLLDGLILAGLPSRPMPDPPADRNAEIAARTACGVHTKLLSGDRKFAWGTLGEIPADCPWPERLPSIPALVLHGETDIVAPPGPAESLAARHATATLVLTKGGAHDVLNDKDHRSVAARIVLFLESLRGTVPEPPEPSSRRSGGKKNRRAAMYISARTDYAIRAAIELAHGDGKAMKCESIARAQGIPLNFLNNLMASLRQAGLVNSLRGCDGGYWLARPPEAISIAEIMRAAEGPILSVQGFAPEELSYNEKAMPLQDLWICVQARLDAMLDGVSLADLAGLTDNDGSQPAELDRVQ